MAVPAAGGGYWEVASDGGIFSLGNAPFYGSVPELPPPGPPRIALYGDSLASEAGQDFCVPRRRLGGHRRESAHFPGPPPATSSRQWPPTQQEWQPTAAVLAFSGDDLHAMHGGLTSSERRSTSQSTKPTPRRRSRSSGPSAPRSYWSGCRSTRPPASVRTCPPSIRSSNRWRTATSASRTTMRARRSWLTGSSPGPSRASPASRARDPTGRTSCALRTVSHFCPNGQTTLRRWPRTVRRLLVRRIPFCRGHARIRPHSPLAAFGPRRAHP